MKCLMSRALSKFIALPFVLSLAACSPPQESQPERELSSSLTIEVAQPKQHQWPVVLKASGELAAWHEAVISAETGSLQIATVVAEVGDVVKKGQVLATLSQESLLAERDQLKAAVQEAKASLEEASANVRRAETVGASGALSEQQLDEYRATLTRAKAELASAQAELKSTEIKLNQTRIVAVDDGVVSSRSALLGEVVSAGTELFRLVRQGRIEWQAELDAQQLAQVEVGDTAQLTLPGGTSVQGEVRIVSPTVDRDTGRGLVYLTVPKDSPARAGMYASGEIELAPSQALTVPDTAVVLRDGRSYVFVVEEDQRVRQIPIETGRRRNGEVEITKGLSGGERLALSGGAFLSDGVAVRLAGSEFSQ